MPNANLFPLTRCYTKLLTLQTLSITGQLESREKFVVINDINNITFTELITHETAIRISPFNFYWLSEPNILLENPESISQLL